MNLFKQSLLVLILVFGGHSINAQRYITQNGNIKFFSETPVENIEAFNNQVSSVIDLANGKIVFSLLMKAFNFEKALMQEHFNEKYVESEKFPKSTFKGQLIDFDKGKISEGKQDVKVKGELSIHGVTQKIEAPGTVEMVDGMLMVKSTFTILLADYDIPVPSPVSDKISETIEIKVNCEYERMD